MSLARRRPSSAHRPVMGWLRRAVLAASALLLSACASAPKDRDAVLPFHDARFAPPGEPVSTDAVFALDAAMRRYLAVEIAGSLRSRGVQAGFVDALRDTRGLKLEYDSARTKNAAEAFATRSGNCLSLVIMTAAFARELGLNYSFASADIDERWSRSGDLLLASGHVNITLGQRRLEGSASTRREMTIDFVPAAELRRVFRREIDEATVLAMFANNRAAEALAEGLLDDAYAWAKLALGHDRGFLPGWNTLGVVYLHHGDAAFAAETFEHVLASAPRDTRSLANLAEAYTRLGRVADAGALQQRLLAVEPEPPFHFLRLGMAALQRGDAALARKLFLREAERDADDHEVHYWLGLAEWRLGDVAGARRELALAMENSSSPRQHDLYAAKLAWLRARGEPAPQ